MQGPREGDSLLASRPAVKSYGEDSPHRTTLPLEASYPSTTRIDSSMTGSAKPIGQFKFLEKSYAVSTPSCLVPEINELFKSICERYDISVTNREKIDEALQLFKQVLELEDHTPLEECFATWRGALTNPTFTVVCKEGSGDVKEIKVRADSIPKDKRKAQKHIRDLLDACHLFLQQRDFLHQRIVSDLEQLQQMASNLQTLGKQANLSVFERKQLPRIVSSAQKQFAQFPDIMDMFWRQVYSLMHNINTAVHALDGAAEPG